MLIVCSEEEKIEMRNKCDGICEYCIFENTRCPIEHNMIITHKEVGNGKNLEVNVHKSKVLRGGV